MTSRFGRVLGAAACAATLGMTLSSGVMAQESDNRVSVTSDWAVFAEGDPKECWGVSVPKESVNTRDGQPVTVRRGDILLFVTYRAGKPGEVSFTGGYPFAPDSTVQVNIDGATFEMTVKDEWAWPKDPAADAQLLTAMKNGGQAVLTARSGKGTQTQDTFSLRGFTAAMTEAEAQCK
jgi:hypothetical protein